MIEYPCTADEAVSRLARMVNHGGQYVYGTGDYDPHDFLDLPWTMSKRMAGSDCAGAAICYAWKLVRSRPGFNKGAWASIEDDINVNSAMEDGCHKNELFQWVATRDVQPGDLLCYPSFTFGGKDFIGHVALVEFVKPRFAGSYRFMDLVVLQCHGPNGFRPGVVRTDGSIWDHHDSIWPLPEHRTKVIRPLERK